MCSSISASIRAIRASRSFHSSRYWSNRKR
jgi:hypothetical protein